MEQHIMWAPSAAAGLEHLHLRQGEQGISVDSVVLGVEEGVPFRLWYEMEIDQNWQIRACTLRLLNSEKSGLTLRTDGQGHWTDATGTPYPVLEGCLDIDLSVSPFTNTLPVRRLAWQPGQSADLSVAYIAVPALEVSAMAQRYTCLEQRIEGGLYRYQSLASGFTRDLPVDAQGLVIDYPGIWQRVSLEAR